MKSPNFQSSFIATLCTTIGMCFGVAGLEIVSVAMQFQLSPFEIPVLHTKYLYFQQRWCISVLTKIPSKI